MLPNAVGERALVCCAEIGASQKRLELKSSIARDMKDLETLLDAAPQ